MDSVNGGNVNGVDAVNDGDDSDNGDNDDDVGNNRSDRLGRNVLKKSSIEIFLSKVKTSIFVSAAGANS